LIGYKDDLDKSLIRSYSNTGVVHVVAISGLHLGLIYALLKYLCVPFGKKTIGRWLKLPIMLSGLWLFSLLAGGAPSVLRSAVMFSSIILGESLTRRSSIINNLSASAFFLLCFDPYWLWDIGFQLSYAALLSIIIFMKPVYGLFIFKNKIADTIWKLNAVTLSAQILTVPVSIYYFHQFPNLFLITNFIAVPLSSGILAGEIILCMLSFITPVAAGLGWVLTLLIRLMNGSVQFLDSFPFSTWSGLDITFTQLVLLYVFIGAAGGWLLLKNKHCLPVALVTLILFFSLQTLKMWS
jgi:competence protein ComEC